jgi:mono/diheme cytochrome c family protein
MTRTRSTPFLLLGFAGLSLVAVAVGTAAAADKSPAGQPAPADPVDFARDVQPIFAAKCYDCHGPAKQKGGVRRDAASDPERGGDSGDPCWSRDPGKEPPHQARPGDGDEVCRRRGENSGPSSGRRAQAGG